MTKDEILEYVKGAGLKPAEIVSMSYGLIPVTQAHDWLRTWKFSMSTTLLLRYYASMKKDSESAGIFKQKEMTKEQLDWCEKNGIHTGDGRENLSSEELERLDHVAIRPKKDSGSAEILKQMPQSVIDRHTVKANPQLKSGTAYTPSIIEEVAPIAEDIQKSWGKLQEIVAKPSGAITLHATGFSSWGLNKTYKLVNGTLKLNLNELAYKADGVTKLGDWFIIDGVSYPLHDFTAV